MIKYICNFFKKDNVHGFNYQLDCTQHNGIYRKSHEEWKNKIEKQYQ